MFRKIPLAWLQVSREKNRLLIALAGIAFADVLMFLQLGFQAALFDSAMLPHRSLKADIVLVNPQFQNLLSVKSFSRERLYQALGTEGVESGSWLYIGRGVWRNPQTRTSRDILVFGTNPAKLAFDLPEVNQNLSRLKLLDWVLFDRASRREYGAIPDLLQEKVTVTTELNNLSISVFGLFTMGASFTADGNVITSDSTFLHLFKNRQPDQIDVGLLNLKPNVNVQTVIKKLKDNLPQDVITITREDFAQREKQYWESSTAIGFIFLLGVIVGFIVGAVIVYQILYSDVSEHLSEYATLKAIGYGNLYLIGVLLQEALLLAVLGFIPGSLISIGIYYLAQTATLLPIRITLNRAILVLILTIVMCLISGVISIRKLQSADPADIF